MVSLTKTSSTNYYFLEQTTCCKHYVILADHVTLRGYQHQLRSSLAWKAVLSWRYLLMAQQIVTISESCFLYCVSRVLDTGGRVSMVVFNMCMHVSVDDMSRYCNTCVLPHARYAEYHSHRIIYSPSQYLPMQKQKVVYRVRDPKWATPIRNADIFFFKPQKGTSILKYKRKI